MIERKERKKEKKYVHIYPTTKEDKKASSKY